MLEGADVDCVEGRNGNKCGREVAFEPGEAQEVDGCPTIDLIRCINDAFLSLIYSSPTKI